MEECPFCNREYINTRTIRESKHFLLFHSKYPVSCGHLLIIPKKHYENIWGMKPKHWKEFGEILFESKDWLTKRYKPDGFNVGWNVHKAGGQTIMHSHCHVIPRYEGDVEDPRGGIRHVIPANANYIKEMEREKEYERSITDEKISTKNGGSRERDQEFEEECRPFSVSH